MFVKKFLENSPVQPLSMGDFCPQGLGLGLASRDTNPALFGATDTYLDLVALEDVSNHDIMCPSREDEPRSNRKT